MRLKLFLLILGIAVGFAAGRSSVAFQAVSPNALLLAPRMEPGCWYRQVLGDVWVSCPVYAATNAVTLVPDCRVSCTAKDSSAFALREYRHQEQKPTAWSPVLLPDGGVDPISDSIAARFSNWKPH